MDAVKRTLFPGGSDSVDDDACSVYTVEMVSGDNPRRPGVRTNLGTLTIASGENPALSLA
jgi:hypothetical protein